VDADGLERHSHRDLSQTSPMLAVSAGVFAKLQLLVPAKPRRRSTTGKPARRRLKNTTIHSPCESNALWMPIGT